MKIIQNEMYAKVENVMKSMKRVKTSSVRKEVSFLELVKFIKEYKNF